uniref:protein-tyrosine-phosphatase n=1 Tax=Pelusios castaneus TaxID=367368 RepID=A0A8C8SRW4_9SAUR
MEPSEPKPGGPEYFNFSEPVIARVMDCIYLGNLNAAYCGRVLCRNGIDSIIDMSSLPSDCSLRVIPCMCSRGELRHSWSRLKASLEKRKRVLIHCLDGYSLAPTCIIQYLMVKHNMRLMAAYEFVRARYPLNIRECHQDMLGQYVELLGTSPEGEPEAAQKKKKKS